MAMKFENKKLDKDDHAKVDRGAGVARNFMKLTVGGFFIKKVPWKKVGGVINQVIFKD